MLSEVRSISSRMRLSASAAAAHGHDGDGRAVMLIPGFMVHASLLARLRRTLVLAGYDAHNWGMGMNRGLRDRTLDDLIDRISLLACRNGAPVALVGWSLGGLFAREAAKLRPDLVERVVTLASPFSGDPRANNAWRAYERLTGRLVDDLPVGMDVSAKPPVPTVALWSRSDGVIAPAAARGLPDERDVEMEVSCRHLDIISSPSSMSRVLEALGILF